MCLKFDKGIRAKIQAAECSIANAAAAYAQAYLSCLLVLSNQIDADILDRYRAERWVVLTGLGYVNDVTVFTYDFMRDIVGYD